MSLQRVIWPSETPPALRMALDKFASEVERYIGVLQSVSSLPTSGSYTGQTVYDTSTSQAYIWDSIQWIQLIDLTWMGVKVMDAIMEGVAASKITGQLTNAQIAGIEAAKLTTQITETMIADDAITTPKIFAGAVTTAEIAANTIVANNIAAYTITGNEIAGNTITAAKIAAGTIGAVEIAAGSIAGSNIAAYTITADKITCGTLSAITANMGLLTAGTLGASTIYAGNLNANQVTTGTLGANVIYAGTLASNLILAGTLNSGVLNTGTMNANLITAGTLGANTIYAGTLAANKILAGTLNSGVLNTGTMNASLITAGTLGAVVINAGTVNANVITTGTMSALRITAGTMSAARIYGDTIGACTISADHITTGTMSAARITAGTMIADRILGGTLGACLINAGTYQQSYTAPGDNDTTPGAGMKIALGKVEAYGGDHSFGGTVMSSDGNYMMLVGKVLTATGKGKRYPLNNATNMTLDGQVHVYAWVTDVWTPIWEVGNVAIVGDYYTMNITPVSGKSSLHMEDNNIDLKQSTMRIDRDFVTGTISAPLGGLYVGITGVNRLSTTLGYWNAIAIQGSVVDGVGVYGYGGSGFGGCFDGDTAPIILVPDSNSSTPAHTAAKGALWVTSEGKLYINTSAGTTWALVGSQT